MQNDYLSWYKDLMNYFHKNPDAISLLRSGVPEPLALLRRQMTSLYDMQLAPLLNTPNPWGHPALIERIATRYSMPVNSIIRTNGATNALFLICQALVRPGDHVLVETPGYQPLSKIPAFIGAEIRHFRRVPPDFSVDLEDFSKTLSPKTRLVIVTQLHNPSGCPTSEASLLAMKEIVQRVVPDAWILVDEVYRDFLPEPALCSARLGPPFLSIASLTKPYGLSILECGWVVGPPEFIQTLRINQMWVEGIGSRYLESLSSIVFDHLVEYRTAAFEHLEHNRTMLRSICGSLEEKGYLQTTIPDHGCIAFPRLLKTDDSMGLVTYLADRYNVWVVPGCFFDAPACVRIGFGGDPEQFESGVVGFEKSVIRYFESRQRRSGDGSR